MNDNQEHNTGQFPDLSDNREIGQWTSRFCPCAERIIYLEKRTLLRRVFVAMVIVAPILLSIFWIVTVHPTSSTSSSRSISLYSESPSENDIRRTFPATAGRTNSGDKKAPNISHAKPDDFQSLVTSQPAKTMLYAIGGYLVAGLGGLLAGLAFSLKWLNHSVAKGSWNIDRNLWRLNTPYTSAIFAVVVTMLFRSELFSLLNGKSLSSWSACGAVGFLTGYFSDNAIAKMNELAIILFGTNPTDKRMASEVPIEKSNGKNSGLAVDDRKKQCGCTSSLEKPSEQKNLAEPEDLSGSEVHTQSSDTKKDSTDLEDSNPNPKPEVGISRELGERADSKSSAHPSSCSKETKLGAAFAPKCEACPFYRRDFAYYPGAKQESDIRVWKRVGRNFKWMAFWKWSLWAKDKPGVVDPKGTETRSKDKPQVVDPDGKDVKSETSD